MRPQIEELINHTTDPELKNIIEAVLTKVPLTMEQGVLLFKKYPLEVLQLLARYRCEELNGQHVYYNRNIHIEPTNKCAYSCKFCAFYRKPKATIEEGAWDYSISDIQKIMKDNKSLKLTEVHITGGVHPYRDLEYWGEVIKTVKEISPDVHVKAYTAVEIAYMAKKAKKTFREVLEYLKESGLSSLPGGGAEIFDATVRKKIAGGKAPTNNWLEIHKTAHELGLQSNATMLYGHIETIEHRLDHMIKIRNLQEETGGFNAFIPLKYRNENNALSHMPEISQEDDLRNYAISRLMIHNIRHLKTYWVMLGLETAKLSLDYGVDDFDGTINDSTRIYSMAGSMEHPSMTEQNIKEIIQQKGKVPVERNSNYEIIDSRVLIN